MARTVILGAGGYAKILKGIVGGDCLDRGDSIPDYAQIVIGVGDKNKRRELYIKHAPRVLTVHAPSAITEFRYYNRGVQVMAGVVIQPGCAIGQNVLINFGALIDHDCNIGDHCVISPGAILCGNVTLGEGCFVGAGAIIIQGVTLPDETFVPAGTLVVGSDDFRKPVRDIRPRDIEAALGAAGVEIFVPEELSEAPVG